MADMNEASQGAGQFDDRLLLPLFRPYSAFLVAGLAAFAATLFLVLSVCAIGSGPGLWGLIFVAMGSLGAGGLIGFIYGSFGTDQENRFGPVFTLFGGLLGGVTLADLSKNDSGLHRAMNAVAVSCGLADGAGGLVLGVVVAFFAPGFMLMYVFKIPLNLLIANVNAQIVHFDKSRATVRNDNLLPVPDPESGGVIPKDPGPDASKAALVLVNRAGAGKAGTPEELLIDAQAFAALNQLDRAAEALRNALRQKPDDIRIEYALARVLLKASGKEKDAIPVLQEVVKSPGAPVSAWMLLGYACLWDNTKLALAIDASKKFLCAFPEAPGALLNLACAHAQLAGQDTVDDKEGHREAALSILERLVTRTPAMKKQIAELRDQDFRSLKDDPRFLDLLK